MSSGVHFEERAVRGASATPYLEPSFDANGPFLTVDQLVAAIRSGEDKFRLTLNGQPAESSLLSLADDRVIIDRAEHLVAVEGRRVDLRLREFQLLTYLALNANIVQTRPEIFAHVWRDTSIPTNSPRLKERIKSIRGVFEGALGDPKMGAIRTVAGVGYVGMRSLSDRPGYFIHR